jgi:hypothetical protein
MFALAFRGLQNLCDGFQGVITRLLTLSVEKREPQNKTSG